MPANVLEFKEKIIIKGRPWLIQEYDNLSTPGIVYYSLAPTTVGKDTVAAAEKNEVYAEAVTDELALDTNTNDKELSSKGILHSNTEYSFATEEGYFTYNPDNIQIKKHTDNEVVIVVPFGAEEITISTKEKGNIISERFKVIL